MSRFWIIALLSLLAAGTALAQREEFPEIAFIRPDPLPLEEIPAAIDESQTTFKQIHRLGRELLRTEEFLEFYYGRVDGTLLWVVDFSRDIEIQTDRFETTKAYRYRLMREMFDAKERTTVKQMKFYWRNGPGWILRAQIRLEEDLPGREIFYCAVLIDDIDSAIDYRIILDARYEGELLRTIFASNGEELIVESQGPTPTDYRVNPFDTREVPVIGGGEDAEAEDAQEAEEADEAEPGDDQGN